MTPVTLIDETRNIGKPKDWDETVGPCSSLSVHDSAANDPEATYNIMTSAWKPDANELQVLNEGGFIYLGIWGINHPVIRLSVH